MCHEMDTFFSRPIELSQNLWYVRWQSQIFEQLTVVIFNRFNYSPQSPCAAILHLKRLTESRLCFWKNILKAGYDM
jgi:hypothetical protein